MTFASQPDFVAPDGAGIAMAAQVLRAGGLVAVPTETVYGLAARADSDVAVAAIYRAKGRPSFNPLLVHVADLAAADRLALMDERALLAASALPLAAPSANRSGAVSPTRPEHVRASLGEAIDLIVDGGACELGLESTIVVLRAGDGWALLRPGPVSEAEIAALLGELPEITDLSRIEAPGQLASHYSPGKPVRLDADVAGPDEFHIGFGPVAGHVSLSAKGDIAEAATRLYAALHEAAASPLASIAVAPIPAEGLGLAVRDRLRRAAA